MSSRDFCESNSSQESQPASQSAIVDNLKSKDLKKETSFDSKSDIQKIHPQPALPPQFPNQVPPNPGHQAPLVSQAAHKTTQNSQKNIKVYIHKPTQSKCQSCGEFTENIDRKRIGQTVYLWSICLMFTTGILCWVPFCVDKCRDVESLCIRCCAKKQMKEADICFW